MRSIQATEVKARLTDILDAVEKGETILINRGGKNIARIVPEPVTLNKEISQTRSIEEAMVTIKSLRTRMSNLSMEDIISARREGLS